MPPVFPAHWHVSQPVLIADTFSSLVWKVSLPDGTPAIVKGLKPIEDIADELRGADYLVWRNGRAHLQVLKSCECSEVITSLQSKHFARFIISFFIKSTQQNLSDFLVFQPIHIAIICNLFFSIQSKCLALSQTLIYGFD